MQRLAIVFSLCCLAVVLVYRKTPTAFLRAESGYYLRMAHADQAAQREYRRQFFTQTQNGHYTPLFFLAEFETAKRFGTNRSLWRSRQLLAVALFAAAAFGAMRAVAAIFPIGHASQGSIAAAVTGLAIFQPGIADFVSWPFMIAQLLWLSLLMVALFATVRLTTRPDEQRWPWIAAGAACLSLQIFGLGFVTAAAVGAVFVFVSFFQRRSRAITFAALLLGCATALQAWLTLRLLPPPTSPVVTPTVHGGAAVKLVLGFIFDFGWAGLGTFSFTSSAGPAVPSLAYCWPLGLLLVVAVCVGIVYLARRRDSDVQRRNHAVAGVAVFSAAGFFALVALIAVREIADAPASGGIVPYFNFFIATPRYLIPLQALLLGPVALLLGRVLPNSRGVWIACGAVVVAAALTQVEFQRGPMKSLLPGTRVSHRAVWELLLTTARESRSAGLPLPNVPLRAVSVEMPADVQWFLPLLRHDLGLKPDDRLDLVAWPFPESTDPQRYAAVPSFEQLEQKLDLIPRRE